MGIVYGGVLVDWLNSELVARGSRGYPEPACSRQACFSSSSKKYVGNDKQSRQGTKVDWEDYCQIFCSNCL